MDIPTNVYDYLNFKHSVFESTYVADCTSNYLQDPGTQSFENMLLVF